MTVTDLKYPYPNLRISRSNSGWEVCDGTMCSGFPDVDTLGAPAMDKILAWVRDKVDPGSESNRGARRARVESRIMGLEHEIAELRSTLRMAEGN
jgi:hypothetical protein